MLFQFPCKDQNCNLIIRSRRKIQVHYDLWEIHAHKRDFLLVINISMSIKIQGKGKACADDTILSSLFR